MGTLVLDLRYALRLLRKTPRITTVAVISLALGIGANTAIFSLLNALVLRSLPIQEPDRLVQLSTAGRDNREGGFSLALYQQLRQDQRVFTGMFAWMGGGIVNLEANGVRYAGSISTVTGEYYSTLGVQPLMGRLIGPEDLSLEAGSPAAVAVLDYRCWQVRYHGDPAIVGKTVRVEEIPLTIIGVTPESFSGLVLEAASDVTVPIGYSGRTEYRDRNRLGFSVYARLRLDATIDSARAQLESIWPAVQKTAGPQRDVSVRIGVNSAATGSSFLRERYRRPLLILMGMVGLLLLVACVNLANLMLARAAARQQEFRVRLALGAARWRLVRQMIAESLLLSAAGTLLGIIAASWATRLLIDTMWSGLVPLAVDPSPDRRVLAFTAFISLLTSLLFGLAPARAIFQTNLDPRQRSRIISGGLMSRSLISAQMALSLVMVIGAVLFMRSLDNLGAAGAGYRRDGVLHVRLFPRTGSESQQMSGRVNYYRELVERVTQLPGAVAASYSHMGPVLSYEYQEPVTIPGLEQDAVQAAFESVGPGFFRLAGMRVLAGREFAWGDNEASRRVAIISESLAARLFPSGNAVGRTIHFGSRKGLEIVGVVNSASLWLPQSDKPAAVYTALMQEPKYNSSSLNIRFSGDPEASAPEVRRLLDSMGRHIALRVQTLDDRAHSLLARDRMLAMLSTFFGAVALFLAALGLYGLMSYAVSRRTSEIGVRLALGAQRGGVIRLILRDVAWMALIGIVAGVPAAAAASTLISGLLFGVSPTDPATIAACVALLLGVALASGYLPALRASRIEPAAALRSE